MSTLTTNLLPHVVSELMFYLFKKAQHLKFNIFANEMNTNTKYSPYFILVLIALGFVSAIIKYIPGIKNRNISKPRHQLLKYFSSK